MVPGTLQNDCDHGAGDTFRIFPRTLDKVRVSGVCHHMHLSVRHAHSGIAAEPSATLSGTTIDLFDDFYRRELPAMIALARSICGDRQLAEDLAQEAFAKAHRDWDRIRPLPRKEHARPLDAIAVDHEHHVPNAELGSVERTV